MLNKIIVRCWGFESTGVTIRGTRDSHGAFTKMDWITYVPKCPQFLYCLDRMNANRTTPLLINQRNDNFKRVPLRKGCLKFNIYPKCTKPVPVADVDRSYSSTIELMDGNKYASNFKILFSPMYYDVNDLVLAPAIEYQFSLAFKYSVTAYYTMSHRMPLMESE